MSSLDIPQSQASWAMSVMGGCELFSRVLMSYVGDRFKGRILYMYVACTLILGVQNAVGSLIYSFNQILLFGVGVLIKVLS